MSTPIAKQIAHSNLSLKPDTYIYTLARLQNACAAISSDDSLTYFDPTSLAVTHRVRDAHKSITCLAPTYDLKSTATAGRDGLIKFWDERAGSAAALEVRNRRYFS